MLQWIRRLHFYAGLLNFTALVVFGMAGLVVTFDAPDIFHAGNKPLVTTRPFTAPGAASDREVAALIRDAVKPANAGPPVIRRNAAHQLETDFYSVNGLIRVIFDEKAGRISIETWRNSIWRFIDNAHASTIGEQSSGAAIRAWVWYIEFSIWCLIFMTLTGVWLGVGARWSYRWTSVSLAAGCIAFLMFWVVGK